MENYAVFTFYGKKEVAQDIVRYCANNPENLDFGDRLDITYKNLEFGCAYVCVIINYRDFDKMCDFRLTAELMREV